METLYEWTWTLTSGANWSLWTLSMFERRLVTVFVRGDAWPALRVETADCDGGELSFSDLDTAKRVAEAIARVLIAIPAKSVDPSPENS